MCLSVTGGVCGSVDGCVCLLQVYVGVLMVVSVCYRSMWSVDGCVCLLQVYVGVLMVVYVCYRCMWEC